MAKRVAFTDQARADIRAIPQPIALQILHTLARFLESDEGNVKRLQGVEPPLYRLRTQDHRVIFRDLGDHVEVTRVRDRKEAYR
jgi:mRNA-degrading endonuclease RelE of RelBE toxin-antitoxin system